MKRIVYIGLGLSLCISALILASGPTTEVHSFREYVEYLSDPDNGLVKERFVNGLKLRVKYLPPDYMAYQELSKDNGWTREAHDSLRSYYAECFNVVLSIGPDDETATGDIMMAGVRSYEDYANNVYDMNFSMERFISLKADSREYKPVLSTLENVYGLQQHRNIVLAFVDNHRGEDLRRSETLDVVFRDELFRTGINHFVFLQSDVQSVPQLKL